MSIPLSFTRRILEDVQRVSDKVAILDNGHLVAEAPIDTLLSGGSSMSVFTVSLKGKAERARMRVADQLWVRRIDAMPVNEHIT